MSIASHAQVTLEHTYTPLGGNQMDLSLVDKDDWKYILFNEHDSIIIYDMNHVLEKIIIVPVINPLPNFCILHFLTKKLFNTDDVYEYMIVGFVSPQGRNDLIRIFNEKGDLIFSCDSCMPNKYLYAPRYVDQLQSIYNTPHGAKLIIYYQNSGNREVYTLQGQLPSITKSNVNLPPTIISCNPISTSAYPNPSDGNIHIEYKLPDGVTSGELIVTTIEGIEVKRYKVGNMFNDILIEKSDLLSGSYFYKLITSKGESEIKRLVVLK
jgi:hypothetical protein